MRMASSPLLTKTTPLLADIFVFSYPLYLIYLYFSHSKEKSRWNILWIKNQDKEKKYHALSLLFTTLGAIIINYAIKLLINQQRPYHSLDLAIKPQESLILNHIPTDAFPSDHAAVSIAIAVSTLIWWYRSHNKNMIIIGWFFVSFSIIMSISRITMGLHRPIDIIGGTLIGLLAALLITYKPFHAFLQRKIYSPLIRFQEYIFSKIKF